jgi:hypothetical protein
MTWPIHDGITKDADTSAWWWCVSYFIGNNCAQCKTAASPKHFSSRCATFAGEYTMAESYLPQATPVGYKQIGFACGAYSLSLVHQLINAASQVPQEQWHANAVGKEYSEYILSRKNEQPKPPPKPLPGGLYGQVKYTESDAPNDDTSKVRFRDQLLTPGYSNPAKMVSVFQAKCDQGWQAKLCYNNAYGHTSLGLVDEFLQQQLALLRNKEVMPDVVDIVASINEAEAGKSYASIVLISFEGEAAPEIAGLHFVTLRKTLENKLQIYDSNDDTFVWHDQLMGTHYVEGKASSGPKLDTLKVGEAFRSCGVPYYYTGFGILYSKS